MQNASGGGGGAGASGSNATLANGGKGGNGVATSISGSSVTYAGGGGGSSDTVGAGGTGFSGEVGASGISGFSGYSGQVGASGDSGFSGWSGEVGLSGISGYSGFSGEVGQSGFSGFSGASGISGYSGFSGAPGSSSSFFEYHANTGSISGYPGDGAITWNNATQTSATIINVSHITDNNVDVDVYLALLTQSEEFVIQDASLSANSQTWEITGTPIHYNGGSSSSYWAYPVTLVSSAGTGTTGFANNHNLIFALVNGVSGFSGYSMFTKAAISGKEVLAVDVAGDPPTTPKKSLLLKVPADPRYGSVNEPKFG